MKLITLDFETYYDKEYSLRKMTPAEYILDERYETICCAVQVGSGPVEVVDGPEFPAWLSQHDPSECVSLTYNALFDNCILAWRYGWVPRGMVDGLGMARSLLGHKLRSLSLEKVADFLNVGVKGSTIHTVLGMRRADIEAAGLIKAFHEYAAQDVRLLMAVYTKLVPFFPKDEFCVMDLVLRCCVEPRFVMNVPKLEAHLAAVIAHKEKLISEAGVDKAQLMASAAFKTVLEGLGVEVETKISPTGNEIPALAKSDDFMNELLEHPDERVQAVAAARLGVKSTLEEKRCERLLAIAKLPWEIAGLPSGTMPVPLRYAGAHTQRLSGDWKINLQNLPSGRGSTSSKLRDALEAPPGHKVVVCDLGQIEARLTAWLTRAPLLQTFKDGKDPYCEMATKIFGYPVTKDNEVERFVGKSAVLGLGFGLGPDNFYIKTAAAARVQGLELGEIWTKELADKTVTTYRKTQASTVQFWKLLEDKLRHEWRGKRASMRLGPIEIGAIPSGVDGLTGYVKGPAGLHMYYDSPGFVRDETVAGHYRPYVGRDSSYGDIWYCAQQRWRKIYGAHFLENIIQFLARIVQMQAALRLHQTKIPFLRMVHSVHDELIFIVPDKYVDKATLIIHDQMTQRPSWGPDIPLKADIGSDQTYGGAKG